MLFTPSWFSIFEMILIVLLRSSMIFFTASTSSFLRTNEWAIKSISMSMAQLMNSKSRSVTDGRLMGTLGMFTLLRGLMTPLFLTRQISSSSFFSVTSISSSPSSIRMAAPTGTSL